MVTNRVGVTNQIQPVDRKPLPEGFVGEEPVDQLFIGIRRFVSAKRFDGLHRCRQTKQVKIQTPRKSNAIRGPDRIEICLLQSGADEMIDEGTLCLYLLIPDQGCIGPVSPVLGTRFDPLPDEVFFPVCERFVELRRRHEIIFVISDDPIPSLAVFEIPGNNRRIPPEVLKSPLARIEPEIRLPLMLVKSVTGEALIRQDGANIAIEVNGPCRLGGKKKEGDEN